MYLNMEEYWSMKISQAVKHRSASDSVDDREYTRCSNA